jgi:uncharacterized protein DUF6152
VKHTLSGLLAVAALLALTAPLVAHHGTASFDTEKELTLNGTVIEWIWSNPHCFLKFDAKDQTGTVRTWLVETQNPTTMTQRGWARTSFKTGDMVKVLVTPVKNGSPIGRIKTVTLATGTVLYAEGPLPGAAAPRSTEVR